MALAKDPSVLKGKHDDNLEGVILTKIAQGELVKIPIPPTYTASGTVSLNQQQALNTDGSTSSLAMSLTASYSTFGKFEVTLYGKVIGIRYNRATSSSRYPFTVIIDGEPHKVSNPVVRDTNGYTNGGDHEVNYIVASDLLNDGPHNVIVGITGDQLSTTGHTTEIFGFIVEAGKGYSPTPPRNTFASGYSAIAVPTTRTSLSVSGQNVKEIRMVNTDTVSHVATVYIGSAIYEQNTIPAGGTAVVSFPDPGINGGSGLAWGVDSGTLTIGYVTVGRTY